MVPVYGLLQGSAGGLGGGEGGGRGRGGGGNKKNMVQRWGETLTSDEHITMPGWGERKGRGEGQS